MGRVGTAAALCLALFSLAEGARRHAATGVVAGAGAESGASRVADSHARASAGATATSGVCDRGQSALPKCCCIPITNSEECRDLDGARPEDFLFHPAARPYEKEAVLTRTCHPRGLCCHRSDTSSCASEMVVRVVSGENLEKRPQWYVKVSVGGVVGKTRTSNRGKWNTDFSFNSVREFTVEVKRKGAFYGAHSYGTFLVVPPFWSRDTRNVSVRVPKFGNLTLRISGQHLINSYHDAVDDDYDASLCSGTESAALLQRADPSDGAGDFRAIVDGLGDAAEPKKPPPPLPHLPTFLDVLNHRPNQRDIRNTLMTRDYTLIIDRSSSMKFKDNLHVPDKMAAKVGKHSGRYNLTRWDQVSTALQYLTPYIVAEDPDGVGVYFFDTKFDKAENMCDTDTVIELFKRQKPRTGTYLADALSEAMEPDTVGRAETIFVLTDGQADDKQAVVDAIVRYSKKMCRSEMLSVSFIQVGSDEAASKYLKRLDQGLEKEGAKFDIVDAMTKDDLRGRSFLDVIEQAVHD